MLVARVGRISGWVGEVRRAPSDAIDTVLFPISGTYSIIIDADDEQVEAATIGREGVVDVYAALGSAVATQTVLSEVACKSIDVGVDRFGAIPGRTRASHSSSVEPYGNIGKSLAAAAADHRASVGVGRSWT